MSGDPSTDGPSTDGPGGVRIEATGELSATDLRQVLDLINAATAADGRRPVSEHAELQLRHGAPPQAVRHVVARGSDGAVLGYGQVELGDPAVAELAVAPPVRARGIGGRLLRAVEEAAPAGRLRVWAHGDLPPARALAAAHGYAQVRGLWVMRRDLGGDLPAYEVPPGITFRAFRPGSQDEDAWLAVNARAFAGHPEQGAMTRRDLRERMAEPWFDPEGFLLAEDTGTGRLLGFHWTKVHEETPQPVGEVYVVGVDPSAQGRGLGPVLTLAGLHHLRGRGLDTVILYVESDNRSALRVYGGLGFTRAETDVLYERRAGH